MPAILLAAIAALLAGPLGPPTRGQPDRPAGIDVSRFERRIGWAKVAGSGVDFAFVQASRGAGDDCTVRAWTCGRDRFYDFNYRRAGEEGIRVGPYHRAFTGGATLAAARRDARAEARVFAGEVGTLQPGDLRPVLDFETPFAGLDPRRLRAWASTWCQTVERLLGARPIIYTNASSWDFTGDTRLFARRGHLLWVAHWGAAHPRVPARRWAGHGWSVWQWTNAGRVPGIRGLTGLDRLGVPLRRLTIP